MKTGISILIKKDNINNLDFEMNIRFLESNVQKACHSIKTIDDVYEYISIEGRLVIKQNEQIMFSEDIAAVEFYWYISKWYNAGGIKQNSGIPP